MVDINKLVNKHTPAEPIKLDNAQALFEIINQVMLLNEEAPSELKKNLDASEQKSIDFIYPPQALKLHTSWHTYLKLAGQASRRNPPTSRPG